jgi:hypothetical protein
MFDAKRLARAGVTRGLLFIDTDHGFNLALDPRSDAPIEVVRWRGDELDRLAWRARDRPPAYRYEYIFTGSEAGTAKIERIDFSASPPATAIEGESLWPVRAQRGAFALPEYASGTCASGGRMLRVHRGEPMSSASVEIELPAHLLRSARVTPQFALSPGASAHVIITSNSSERAFELDVESWESGPLHCRRGPSFTVETDADRLRLTITPKGRLDTVIALDRLDLDLAPRSP